MGIATAQTQTCVRLIACVDGSDIVKVDSSQLSITHGNFQAIGAHLDCPDPYKEKINVDGTPYSISLIGSSYKIGGNDFLSTGIQSLNSFNLISIVPSPRDPADGVTLNSVNLLINDDKTSGPAVYTIDLCGEPTPISTPEFPTVALPAALLVGLIGAVLFIQRSKEN